MQFPVLGQVLLPGYGYFTHVKSAVVFNRVPALQDPELLARVHTGAQIARLIKTTVVRSTQNDRSAVHTEAPVRRGRLTSASLRAERARP